MPLLRCPVILFIYFGVYSGSPNSLVLRIELDSDLKIVGIIVVLSVVLELGEEWGVYQ